MTTSFRPQRSRSPPSRPLSTRQDVDPFQNAGQPAQDWPEGNSLTRHGSAPLLTCCFPRNTGTNSKYVHLPDDSRLQLAGT